MSIKKAVHEIGLGSRIFQNCRIFVVNIGHIHINTEQNRTEILLDVNYTVSGPSYYFNNKRSVGHTKQIYMSRDM